MSSNSSNGFSPVSFTGSPPGTALTGGAGATSGPIYIVSMSYAPNGNVLTANDSANGNWTYGYDDLNRLVASNKNSGQQTYSYIYDRFGSRWQQNAPQGGSVFLATFTGGNNRLDGASHDAAGNMTTDPSTGATYTYDAENRIAQVNGGSVTYTYDADGQRVEKNVGGVKTDYVYDAAGHAIAEINGSGTVTREELFVGGKHLGTYLNNTTYFSHGDWLGTERVRSDMTGAACETISSLPFGDGQASSGNCGDPSTRHFTGKERDLETGLDYFGARYYGSAMGQFITPDWAAKATAVPYAEFADPQSLNLYSYVRNVPTTRYDADGHCQGPQDGCLAQQQTNNTPNKVKDPIEALKGFGKQAINTAINALNLTAGKVGGGDLPLTNNDQKIGASAANQALAAAPLLGELKATTIVAELGANARAPSVMEQLQGAANDAVQNVGPGRGAVYGAAVHSEFADLVDGLGNSNLSTEVSYKGGVQVSYGTPGSIRVDAVEGPLSAPTAVYDLKTGSATLTPARIQQIQSHLPGGSNVPVQEIRPQ